MFTSLLYLNTFFSYQYFIGVFYLEKRLPLYMPKHNIVHIIPLCFVKHLVPYYLGLFVYYFFSSLVCTQVSVT